MKIIDITEITKEQLVLLNKTKILLENNGITVGLITAISGEITAPRTIYIEQENTTLEFGLILK